jgi:hypothetical protein
VAAVGVGDGMTLKGVGCGDYGPYSPHFLRFCADPVIEPIMSLPMMAKCSQDTALRDIVDLVERGILAKDPAGGRSTSYSLLQSELRSAGGCITCGSSENSAGQHLEGRPCTPEMLIRPIRVLLVRRLRIHALLHFALPHRRRPRCGT